MSDNSPNKITEGTFVRDLLFALDESNVVHCAYVRGEPAMHTQDLSAARESTRDADSGHTPHVPRLRTALEHVATSNKSTNAL